jgi:DNA polymerase-1
MSKTLLLLDGANLMQRARFSSRRNLKGKENAIIYSFFRSLRPLVEKFSPDKIVLALEGRPVRRLELHKEYKANRVYDNSDDYGDQRQVILELLQHLPVTTVRHPLHEADDVIGHYALDGDWERRVVVSSDSDFIQLLNSDPRVEVYNPITKKYREAPCNDYVGWKALVGDSSDNIEGFHGVGNKTALKLLESHNKLSEFLTKHEGYAKYQCNRELVAFEPVDPEQIEIKSGKTNWDTLIDRFRDLGFWSMVNDTAWPKYVKTFIGVENVR